ncbi:NKAP domain containing 1 [Latimeria chalumnae]|uniref:NKAP domain containing 1 n=1 Tax=Latimeria chalumnae TaxID=7897 RepID=H3B7P1_LATCH|nr:PREDICTED: uncharacterized protein C11orf57 homolog [Latimeria chalumnae]|eukprot:XP_005987294.1 PREDICTED: uncharacterized protein C11orf57 homolog [Latimeria chalumnae]
MSRVPLGKILLRNVIRHTDAHNKIQEESEMWKMRQMEKQSDVEIYKGKRKRDSPSFTGSRMRCDGYDDDGNLNNRKPRCLADTKGALEQDVREARYWTKKLYQFEADDPDRWGHSGYKELYPEEFQTDSEEQDGEKKNPVNGKKRSLHQKLSHCKSQKHKRSKKSHKKKHKKQSLKKMKKKRRRRVADSSSSGDGSVESTSERQKARQKHRKKAARKGKSKPVSSSGRESESTGGGSNSSNTGESGSEEEELAKRIKEKKKKCSRSKAGKEADTESRKAKKKNWKTANDEKSEESSEED